ncbi:hypothetical protein Hhel01_02529 [Haloferula helveola]
MLPEPGETSWLKVSTISRLANASVASSAGLAETNSKTGPSGGSISRWKIRSALMAMPTLVSPVPETPDVYLDPPEKSSPVTFRYGMPVCHAEVLVSIPTSIP